MVVGLAALWSCGEDKTGPPPTATGVQASAGDAQTTAAGTAVATAPAALVTGANGPISGVMVAFAVAAGGGMVTGASATSNSNGIATAGTWVLGTSVGPNTLTATVAGLPQVTFTAQAIAGAPAAVLLSAGNNQSATVGMPVAVNPAVRVDDQFGNIVENVSVTFAVTGGGGSVTAAAATTSTSGVATAGGWTLGTTAGPNELTATVTGVPAFVFSATGTADMAATIAINAGDNQSAPAATDVPVPPSVLLTDAKGNPVPSTTVVFAVASGGGSVTNGTTQTDASGVATVGSWTLGNGLGANTLEASTGSLTPVTFTATATQGPAAIVSIDAGDGQSATVGTAVATAPRVLVTDLGGNPVSGEAVTFAVASGGGSATGTSATTGGAGLASVGSWTLGTAAGANTLTATVSGLTPVTFTATGTAGAPATMVLDVGDGQTATAGTAVAIDPSVLVEDANGNPVPSASVTFTPTSGGGNVTGSPAVTNASGIATVGSWILGGTPGANTLDATLAALPAVTFTATGVGGAANIQVQAGDGQSATVGQSLATAPSVLVTDGGSNPVHGVTVDFAVASGGGGITGASTTTNASGIATVGSWTLGTVAGANTLTATAQGGGINGNPVTFTATGTADAAASIAVNDGDGQSALQGTAVPIAPSVIVQDQFSNPVQGVTVDFLVLAGGGSITGASPATDAAGIARVGSWTINAGANSLEATAQGLGIAGNPALFSATGTLTAFDVEVRYNTGTNPTASQLQAFADAEARWEQLITGNLLQESTTLGAGQCGSSSPAINETIDDVVILVTLAPIDGPNGILGQAGPCWIRDPGTTDEYLPSLGVMEFDTDDLGGLESAGLLEEVILHEMGHVLGFGIRLIWDTGFGLLQNPSCGGTGPVCSPDLSGADTHFSGTSAVTSFDNVGGTAWTLGSKVPLENTLGGRGTRDSHWRESTFVNELMTGFINGGANPLSEVTVASLQDIGYVVNVPGADPYALANPNALRTPVLANGFALANDVLAIPIYTRDSGGRIRVVRPR
jgi:adhesin/invasin